jgi:ADP-ribose pyrophosphatase YjhB (NUDIX family)
MNVDAMDGEGCLARAHSSVTLNKVHAMYGSVVVHGMGVRVGVGVVIRGSGDTILLERRRDCGWWGLPGGKVEPGESLVDTAVREVCEETGLAVEVTHLIGVYSDPRGRIVTYPDNGDVVQLIDVIVGARVLSGSLLCSQESEEVRFFTLAQLPEEIVPPARQPIADAFAGYRGVLR